MHNIAVRSSIRCGSGMFMTFFKGASSSDGVDLPGDTVFRSERSLRRGMLPPRDGNRVSTGLLRQSGFEPARPASESLPSRVEKYN